MGYEIGDTVAVQVGTLVRLGTINYKRMAPPTYNMPAAYSVLLNATDRPGYVGTIVAPAHIYPERDYVRCKVCGKTQLWHQMELLGPVGRHGEPPPELEYANCACGATTSREYR